MKNDIVVGFSCCLIGSYNFWSFYNQDRLYLFNFSFYFSTFLIGILFLYRAWFYHCKSLQTMPRKQQIFQKKIDQSQSLTVFLEELHEDSKKYKKISNYIDNLMKIKGNNYSLKKIYWIKNESIKSKFKTYQTHIAETYRCEGLQGPANTNYNFHGTRKMCENSPCLGNNSKDCSLCNILKNGFKIEFSGKGASTNLRFGNGIYFSPNINKALNYVSGQSQMLLMCKVVQGKVYFAKDNDSHLDEFNENKYHSICGDPRVTLDLKQPEICVFKDEAAWPKYILEFKEN